jgi:small conductance mechanosensitive channel
MNFDQMNIQIITSKIMAYLPTLAGGLITLIAGFWIAGILTNRISNLMKKREVDDSLKTFLTSCLSVIFKIVVILSALGIMGIQTTSFIAILGSAGLAVGLALQGSLSNFAGGVLIILFKPFKVGDVIDAQGVVGSVDKISIFVTRLKTPDNKVIFVPNGPLANGNITNITTEDTRRVDFTFGIGYDDDIKKAKDIIFDTIKADSRVLNTPEPFIAVSELADSSVNFVVRVWSKTSDYWGVYFDGLENVKIALDKNNISIPYPQTDIHVKELTKLN